jgi:hypothetical protein
MMRIDPTKALIAYAGVTTAAIAYALVTAAAPGPRHASFSMIDVGRINVREPDGTIRMVISNTAQAPGIVIRNGEHPHPSRRSAGMIFFNDEGTENGGLIFDGKADPDGTAHSGGSLTFDRYEQDQVVQMFAEQDGADKTAGFNVFDRPDKRMDFDLLDQVSRLPPEQRKAFYEKAGILGQKRMFIGRDRDGSARVVLRDGEGRERLAMSVSDAGAARIDFLDTNGKVTRSVTP